jgi:hypothetical protein
MALDAGNVQVAATGAIYMSTVGATAPTNSTAAWSTAWKELGYMNEDGFTENPSLDSEEIKAWQSGAIVRRVVTGSGHAFSFTAIETNNIVLDLFYPGSTLTQETGPPVETKVQVKLVNAVDKAFGFDVLDGTDRIRIVVPKARLSERGEISYKNSEPVAYPFTVSVEPDSTGLLCIKYHNPQLAAA